MAKSEGVVGIDVEGLTRISLEIKKQAAIINVMAIKERWNPATLPPTCMLQAIVVAKLLGATKAELSALLEATWEDVEKELGRQGKASA